MNTLKFINGVYYANGKPQKTFYSAIKFIESQMPYKRGVNKK